MWTFFYVKKDERYFRKYKIISKCCCLNGSYFTMLDSKLKSKAEEKNAQQSIDGFECKITHLTFAICKNQNADLLKYNLFEWQIINRQRGEREKERKRDGLISLNRCFGRMYNYASLQTYTKWLQNMNTRAAADICLLYFDLVCL